jgi:hypothetical protein
VTVAVTVSLTP